MKAKDLVPGAVYLVGTSSYFPAQPYRFDAVVPSTSRGTGYRQVKVPAKAGMTRVYLNKDGSARVRYRESITLGSIVALSADSVDEWAKHAHESRQVQATMQAERDALAAALSEAWTRVFGRTPTITGGAVLLSDLDRAVLTRILTAAADRGF